MYLFADVELWMNLLARVLMTGAEIWAAVDCITRKGPAFPAAGKLTKPAWLAITLGAAFLTILLNLALSGVPYDIWHLVPLIAALVYLADVRPAVREVSGGSGSRW